MLFKWIFSTGLKSESKTSYISGAISVVPKLEIFGTNLIQVETIDFRRYFGRVPETRNFGRSENRVQSIFRPAVPAVPRTPGGVAYCNDNVHQRRQGGALTRRTCLLMTGCLSL